MNLQALKDAADNAGAQFDRVCLQYYPDARWGGYRAIEADKAPADVIDAMEAYHDATHAFYLARDGRNGFLGSAYREELTPAGPQLVIPGCERVDPDNGKPFQPSLFA